MYKLIDSSLFFPEDEPTITIIDIEGTKNSLEKRAADSRIQEYASSIKPDPAFIYVHILALSSGNYFGANRNSDFFPEENLIKYHKTFETSPSYIYRNHVNRDPAKSIGKVIFSAWNERMHRVELIAEIDKVKGVDIVARIEAGDFPATSMACRTPSDTCSICGNVAKSRQQYCSHLRNDLGKMYPDGRKVMAINDSTLVFFDQSIVVKPADLTSSILSKVASEHYGHQAQSSAELAEEIGLEGMYSGRDFISKQANLQKLSEFIKDVDSGVIVDSDPELDKMLAKVKDLDFSLIKDLKHFKLNDTVEVLASLGINPSLAFLSELIAVKLMGSHMEGSGHTIASLIHKVDTSAITIPNELSEEASEQPSPLLSRVLTSSMAGSSLLPEYVEKRAYIFEHPTREDFTGTHYNNNIGYIGSGQNGHIERTPFENWADLNNSTKTTPGFMKVLNTLLAVGGAAIAIRWYINQAVEKKLRENITFNHSTGEKNTKLLLVKQSSDYRLTHRLSKAAMVKCIKERSKI